MKTKILKSSFRLFLFLAEKTGGWRIFVQPKLWLGIILLGSVISCTEPPEDPEDPENPEDPKILCYYVGPPQKEQTSHLSAITDAPDVNTPLF